MIAAFRINEIALSEDNRCAKQEAEKPPQRGDSDNCRNGMWVLSKLKELELRELLAKMGYSADESGTSAPEQDTRRVALPGRNCPDSFD